MALAHHGYAKRGDRLSATVRRGMPENGAQKFRAIISRRNFLVEDLFSVSRKIWTFSPPVRESKPLLAAPRQYAEVYLQGRESIY